MAKQREWQNGKPGKLAGQKLKSLLVIQYILKNADEDHPVSMEKIRDHLGKYGMPQKYTIPTVSILHWCSGSFSTAVPPPHKGILALSRSGLNRLYRIMHN